MFLHAQGWGLGRGASKCTATYLVRPLGTCQWRLGTDTYGHRHAHVHAQSTMYERPGLASSTLVREVVLELGFVTWMLASARSPVLRKRATCVTVSLLAGRGRVSSQPPAYLAPGANQSVTGKRAREGGTATAYIQ